MSTLYKDILVIVRIGNNDQTLGFLISTSQLGELLSSGSVDTPVALLGFGCRLQPHLLPNLSVRHTSFYLYPMSSEIDEIFKDHIMIPDHVIFKMMYSTKPTLQSNIDFNIHKGQKDYGRLMCEQLINSLRVHKTQNFL